MRKRWMTGVVLVAAVGAVLVTQAACSSTQSPLEQLNEERTISVSGSGTVSAAPDQVVLRLGVEAMAASATAAMSRNNEQMQAVIAALTDAGIPAEDIQTQTVQLRAQYDRPELEPTRSEQGSAQSQQLVGYVASNVVEVSSEDIGAVGALLDAAVQAGANRVEGIRFEVSNPSELLGQAREAAWADAEQKALQLTDLAGENLGDVHSIQESTSTPRPVALGRAVELEAAVPIEPGTEEIRVDLQVTWTLR